MEVEVEVEVHVEVGEFHDGIGGVELVLQKKKVVVKHVHTLEGAGVKARMLCLRNTSEAEEMVETIVTVFAQIKEVKAKVRVGVLP